MTSEQNQGNRFPEACREEEVRTILNLGVIEVSHSAWSSPIVLIGKPDGSLRFCNDSRKQLNIIV